ncbi:MAG: 50S ribosomal protein L9 [Oligoflexales bacterium]|nr:50S ribosomal protein L9 [Oligoflexales bacterium]
MKVILTEDVPNLGSIGSLVQVKNGYARNYLLPRLFAVVANERNQKELEHKKKLLETKKQRVLSEAQVLAEKVSKVTLVLLKQTGEEDRIFGTVTTAEVVEQLASHGLKFSKKDLHFPEDIKKTGSYVGELRIHSEVVAKVKIQVNALPK